MACGCRGSCPNSSFSYICISMKWSLNILVFLWPCSLKAQDTIIMPLSGNGGFYNTCYATIYDNGLDSNYANYSHSTITIAPLWVQSISLYFEMFDTEIYFDSLNIYDGPGTAFPLIGTYSGTTLQGQTVSSTGNSITLEFRSDDIATGSGFKAWVSCIMSNEELNTKDVVLYPNPANNSIQIIGVENVKSISIMDVQGRIIKCQLPTAIIDVSFISPGMYGLLIELQDGKTIYKKWIKE